jgi:YVTN family beta-propeller protein
MRTYARTRVPAFAGALLVMTGAALAGAAPPDNRTVGRQTDGSVVTPANQTLRPAGTQIEFPGRPTQVAMHPGGRYAAILSDSGTPITVLDIATGAVVQRFDPGRGDPSSAGLAYSPDGKRLYASFAGGVVVRADVFPDGSLNGAVGLPIPAAANGKTALPGGLAVSNDGRRLYVTLSRRNELAVLDTATGRMLRRIATGNAPYAVALAGNTAIVSDRGGRPYRKGDRYNWSSGTRIVSTPTNGAAATGTVTLVDTRSLRVRARLYVGLHPTGIAVRGRYAFVTNTNSDSVSVVDVPRAHVVTTIAVTPFPGAPYGSSPNSVTTLGTDRLVVTLGRNNALAFYRWTSPAEPARFEGLLPTGWYPADVEVDGVHKRLVVANDKGVGSLSDTTGGSVVGDPPKVTAHRGSLSLVAYPDAAALATGTQTVRADNAWAAAASARAPARTVPPRAVPERVGEPSLIKHVFYVIKENRTYDQVLGDDPRGNGDDRYVQFGAAVTPNQHLLAQRFPLFDNFYVSGSLSPDGHQWATQAYVTDYIEKSYGDFTRGYSYDGGDALAYAPTGFLWENAQRHGRSVRVYGEFASHADVTGTRSDVPSLDKVLVRKYPKYDLEVSDADRAGILLADVNAHLAAGSVADLTIVQLPRDHTRGLSAGKPTPESDVADNDNALGKLVDTLSHSAIWPNTAVFAVEDDAQAGLDHVDGHRTTAYIASPYVARGLVDHTYYTQINLVRTIEQILGLPPMNQMDLAASPMTTAFTETPDVTPYSAIPVLVPPVNNPALPSLSGIAKEWALASDGMDFSVPDAAPEQLLNRAIWYSVRGFVPYPGDGRVLTPAEVRAKYAAVAGDDEEERASGAHGAAAESDEGESDEVLSTTGAGQGMVAAGLVLLAVAALGSRTRHRMTFG